MKALSFAIPNTEDELIRIQTDDVPYFYDEYHFHQEIQITYFTHGYGTCIIGDQLSQFKAGDLFVIGSNLPHVFKSDKEFYTNTSLSSYSQSILINTEAFPKELLQKPDFYELNQFISNSNFGLKYSIKHDSELINFFDATFNSSGLKKLIHCLRLIMGLSDQIESNLLKKIGYKSDHTESDSLILNKVFQYSLNNYTSDISLDSIAQVATMSKPSFCRFFKKRTRKTFAVFLNEVRIQEACKLLRSTDKNISEIAYLSGFNNISNFNRQFKKVVFCSPKEFRNKNV